jgi:carbon storage regulator
MLVLTRRRDQSVRIGSTIEVRVLEVGNGYVRLGISAPRHVSIYRDEVYRRILEENREARQVSRETAEHASILLGGQAEPDGEAQHPPS